MTSSAEPSLFTCTMRLTFRGGAVVSVPMVSFTDKADAEKFNQERAGFLGAVARGGAMLPTPTRPLEMPLMQVLQELGLAQVSVGIEPGELRNSALVVAKPKIIIAS